MNQLSEKHTNHTERGSAGIRLLLVLVVLVLVANAGFNYIPVAYQAENFKQDMQTALIQGIALPPVYGKPSENIKNKIIRAARSNDLPADIFVNVSEQKGLLTARVFYVKKVPVLPFAIYEYDYVFDHVATPSGFLTE